jgi:glycosyltransferase involved in cell wall biosynthesis
MTASGQHVLVTMRLNDAKARDKLQPLLLCEAVERVTLVRHAPVDLHHPKLHQVIYGGTRRNWSGWLNAGVNLWITVQTARRQQPDWVIGNNLTPYGIIAWLAARLTGRRSCISLIGTDFNNRIHLPLLGVILRAILRNSDRVTIFGEDARAEMIEGLGARPDRVFSLLNTADTERFHPDPQVQPTIDLIFVGNLLPNKQVDVLLRTLALVSQTHPDTRLYVVGDGPERDRLATLAASLGMARQVTFTGRRSDVAELLRQAKILALLSESEGLPMAMIEAMCSGLPVIVTDAGANASVVADSINGYIIPQPVDPALVADRIRTLLDDPTHYAAMRAAALRLRETHGYPHGARMWENILSV